MKKIYISSTYKDLKPYRRAVYDALRKVGKDVISMEDYVSKDQCTRARCEADVAACDLYIGIVAWRYGFIPEEDNPDKKSITEMEYDKAEKKTRLTFLLESSVPWPPQFMDSASGDNESGKRVTQFRADLAKRSASTFTSPDDLATQVIAAVYQDESTRRFSGLGLFEDLKTFPLGPSLLPNIDQKIHEARELEAVVINLGSGASWWTTRLLLVAALASDFTRIRQLIFVDGQDRFVGMYSPSDIRLALASAFPKVEIAYLQSLTPSTAPQPDPVSQISAIIANFTGQLLAVFQGEGEATIKEWVTPTSLQSWTAGRPRADAVELVNQSRILLQHQIVTRRSPYVALVEGERLTGVVDRTAMATNLARDVLQESLR